ncbi:hypothetical protein [Enterococcus sp. AZ101]|uniref:hypothetical protein n=1 Tax=Enterococcus sp. AZ101 TaxID=2774742 RepID=UPI003D29F5E8
MAKNKKNEHLINKEELVELLNNYSSTFHRIEKSIEKKEDSKLTKFRKNVLPYFVFLSLILSGLSLWWSFKIYNLGEQYKKSLNPITFKLETLMNKKVSSGDNYLRLDPYDRYPISFDQNTGEINEKYLFKYNVESKNSEPIKLEQRVDDDTKIDLNTSKNSKTKDLQAYIQIRNNSNNFNGSFYDKLYSNLDNKYLENKDEILCILDPSTVDPTHKYIGIYVLAMVGKNDKLYLYTFMKKQSDNFDKEDIFYYFDGLNLFDEHAWKTILQDHPEFNESKEMAYNTYNKSLEFLKNNR